MVRLVSGVPPAPASDGGVGEEVPASDGGVGEGAPASDAEDGAPASDGDGAAFRGSAGEGAPAFRAISLPKGRGRGVPDIS